jgi:hypothetical protein
MHRRPPSASSNGLPILAARIAAAAAALGDESRDPGDDPPLAPVDSRPLRGEASCALDRQSKSSIEISLGWTGTRLS